MEQMPQMTPKPERQNPLREQARKLLKTIGISAALSAGVITQADAQKKEAVRPIITHDVSDPRVKAYDDSLYAYKKGEQYFSEGTKVFEKGEKVFDSFEKKESPLHDPRIAHVQPEKFHDWGEALLSGSDKKSEYTEHKTLRETRFPLYKKPVQPVFAEELKPVEPIIVHDQNDPRLKKYQDSLRAHETFEPISTRLEQIADDTAPIHPRIIEADSLWKELAKHEDDPYQMDLEADVHLVSLKDKNNRKTEISYPAVHYQKPVQEVRYEKPAPEYFKEAPFTYPVYGPKGGLLGVVTEHGGFTPLASGEREHLKDGLGVHADDEKILEAWDKGQADPYLSTQGVKIEDKK